MSDHPVKPSGIALVLCDNIYQDPGGKTALVGLFNAILTPKVPVTHPRLAVFVSLTGLRSGGTGRLEIIHGETDDVIDGMEGPFPKEVAATDVIDMSFFFQNLVFPEAATYFVRFSGNGHPIMERRFEILSPPSE